MHALIDFDWASYAFGNATDAEYKPLRWPLVKSRIDGTIDKILLGAGADTFQLYLTENDKSNFRFRVATICPYKGQRPTDKPRLYEQIRDYLVSRGALVSVGCEADDDVSIASHVDFIEMIKTLDGSEYTKLQMLEGYKQDLFEVILCHIDKDIDIRPGWHYNWLRDEKYFITPIEGLRNFYKQCLTGDSVDNILGLFGVGKKSKLLTKIDDLDNELSMYKHVLKQYQDRFGTYAEQFLLENGRLLWMQTYTGEMWTPPDEEAEQNEVTV